MRFAAACLLTFLLADVTPGRGNFRETRWKVGDFVAAGNDNFKTVVDSGETVSLHLAGWGESCLIRRRAFPLKLPCRLGFRIRWTDCTQEFAYPSVHVLFDPPPVERAWWKGPIENRPGHWQGGLKTFLFHFSTLPAWRRFGVTEWVESAEHYHGYSPPKGAWLDVEVRLEASRAQVFVDGKKVAECAADLRAVRTFTYGIGDQTGTTVELDEFRCENGC